MEKDLINRLNTSIKFLNDRQSFKVGEFVLGMIDANTVFVNGYSNFYNIENLSRTVAKKEFIQMKSEFSDLMTNAIDFIEFIKDKKIIYSLVVDLGNGGVNICQENNGELEFFI